MKLSEIASALQGKLYGDGALDIQSVAPIHVAQKGQLTFLLDKKHRKDVLTTQASAIITLEHLEEIPHQIVVPHPKKALAATLTLFHPHQEDFTLHPTPIHPTADIHPTANVGHYVSIGAHTRIGANCKIGNNVTIGDDCQLGENCILYPNVTILNNSQLGNNVIIASHTTIGKSGFGHFPDEKGVWHHVPQVGRVVLEDNVEIGTNCAVDRACMGETRIKRGTKIDNLVQIAHNSSVGEHCLIVSQSGLAGSSTLGNHVIVGGQVGVDGATVGEKSYIAGRSGVTKDLPAGSVVSGFPAWDHKKELKKEVTLRKWVEKGRITS